MRKKIYWTDHSKLKMRQYGLSKSKLLQLLYKPERKEQGIVAGTIAVMQVKKSYKNPKKIINKESNFAKASARPRKSPGEIWLMYQDVKDQRKIISAWFYPGVSKSGESIPVPAQIRRELLDLSLNNYSTAN